MNPSSDLRSVLLPAPFGPKRPTAPFGKTALTSRRARFEPYATVTWSSATAASITGPPTRWPTGASPYTKSSGLWFGAEQRRVRSPAPPDSERPSQAEHIGRGAEVPNDVGDVGVERQANFLSALDQILSRHAPRKRLVLHPLHHGRRFEVEHALRRPDERGRRDEASHLVAREKRLLQASLPRDPGIVGVRQDRARHPVGVAHRRQDLDAAERVVFPIGVLLVVEVVHQRDEAPGLLIFTPLPRVAAHRRLDREQVLPEALALDVLGDEGPGPISGQQGLRHVPAADLPGVVAHSDASSWARWYRTLTVSSTPCAGLYAGGQTRLPPSGIVPGVRPGSRQTGQTP